jgi:hypothetical protein
VKIALLEFSLLVFVSTDFKWRRVVRMDYVVGWIMWLEGLCVLMDYVVGWIMWLDGLCV